MKLGRLIMQTAILAGFAGGALFAILRGSAELPGNGVPQPEESQPVVLNVASPPPTQRILLREPVSLEGVFGRGELSGQAVQSIPQDPLHELDVDRRWDVALALAAPRPGAELPPARAADERPEPRGDETQLRREYDFTRLPPEARAAADGGLRALRDGLRALREGDRLYREPGEAGQQGRDKIRQAAQLSRKSIELLETALRFAPGDRELLVLLREAKANLYHCMKHGM